MESKKKVLIAIIILIVVLSGFWFISKIITNFTGRSITGVVVQDFSIDNFAQCLSDSGVVMYGSKYCGYCKKQKEMFGDSFSFINYIECVENPDSCSDLEGVPAWIVMGKDKVYYGVQTFESLSKISGCKI